MDQKKWSIILILYLASIISVMNQYKAMLVNDNLLREFAFDPWSSGWIMAMVALAGIVMAFPAVKVIHRLGVAKGSMLAIVVILCGNLLGAVATDWHIFMFSRFLEGTSIVFFAILSPIIIIQLFGYDKAALPLGIWATWLPVGSMASYILPLFLVGPFPDWRSIWLVAAVIAVVVLLIMLYVFEHISVVVDTETFSTSSIQAPSIWLLGAAFFAMILTSLGILIWVPEYFSDFFRMDHGIALDYTVKGFLCSIPSSIIAGIILTKLRQRYVFLIGCTCLSAFLYTVAFLIPQAGLLPYSILVGLDAGFSYTVILIMVPVVLKGFSSLGYGMAVIAFAQSIAMFIAGPLYGYFTTGGQWMGAVLPSAVILLLGFIFAAFLYEMASDEQLILTASKSIKQK